MYQCTDRPRVSAHRILEGRTFVQYNPNSPHIYIRWFHLKDLLFWYKMRSTVRKRVQAVWTFLDSGLFSPRATMHEPIVLLLNHQDKDERDRLTGQWRDNKLAELNFVGIVVSTS